MSYHVSIFTMSQQCQETQHVSTFTMSQQCQETQHVSTLAPLPPITAKSNTIAVNYNSRKLFL